MQRQTVRVALAERSYDIQIGAGLLAECGSQLLSQVKTSHAIVIADSNTLAPHANTVSQSLRDAGLRVDVLQVPAGEGSKSVAQLDQLWQQLLACKADRKSVVVAVGGGVIGDLAGFVAASYARGIPFFQVPTTLLAQVDSSVGGKTGINLPLSKNMVGAFWQPVGVLIDVATLDTLPRREYLSGLAEVVKYGVILDPEFFAFLENNVQALLDREPSAVAHIVRRSCELKAEVVRQDEREETGLRAILNYGHTFAHAIEAVAGYGEYLHGEAVSIGMVCAADLAVRLGRFDAELAERQRVLLEGLKIPTGFSELDTNTLLSAMQRDKKVEHGLLRFVLPSRLGHVELVPGIEEKVVRSAWESARIA